MPPVKKAKLGKDPTVNTSFLPDRQREEEDRRLREALRQDWLKRQEELKKESIEIVFSYWDGSGRRKEVECKKGDTIGQFLEKAKMCFDELRSTSVDNLMYIVRCEPTSLCIIVYANGSLVPTERGLDHPPPLYLL